MSRVTLVSSGKLGFLHSRTQSFDPFGLSWIHEADQKDRSSGNEDGIFGDTQPSPCLRLLRTADVFPVEKEAGEKRPPEIRLPFAG